MIKAEHVDTEMNEPKVEKHGAEEPPGLTIDNLRRILCPVCIKNGHRRTVKRIDVCLLKLPVIDVQDVGHGRDVDHNHKEGQVYIMKVMVAASVPAGEEGGERGDGRMDERRGAGKRDTHTQYVPLLGQKSSHSQARRVQPLYKNE